MADAWWWDLTNSRPVTGAERPRDVEALGPYPTRQAAEDWKSTNKARNESWDADDERWAGDGPDADADA